MLANTTAVLGVSIRDLQLGSRLMDFAWGASVKNDAMGANPSETMNYGYKDTLF